MAIRVSRPLLAFVVPTLALAAAFAAPAIGAPQPKLPGLPGAGAAASPSPSATPEPAAEAPDSPRASLRSFVELTRKGKYAEAARYLVLDGSDRERGPELASRLRAVLDRHLDLDLDAVSPLPEGNRDDALPPGTESLGAVPDAKGAKSPVYFVRTRDGSGTFWAFSRGTVAHVDGWYDGLEDRWIRDSLPQALLRHGPRGLLLWQWLALPVLALAALVIGRLLGTITRSILHRLARRTPTQWDERLLERTAPALTIFWAIVAAVALLPWLALLPEAQGFVRSLLGGAATLAVFWALWRSVDVVVHMLVESPSVADNPSARSLLSVSGNLVKAFVAVGGVVATVAAFGYPVATVLAGLGIGGIALAFGAQKTVENLFGSVALAVDQPFRVGDFVKVEDFTGNVERIGLRSTQIRTLDRTLITIPNGALSEMRLETFAARDRIRFTATVGLVSETTEEQMTRVVDGIERMLRAHPKVWPDAVVAKFCGLGASSLDVEVLCWFQTADFDEFRALRQEALLGILRAVREAGTDFAFSTHTVKMVGPAAPPRGGACPPETRRAGANGRYQRAGLQAQASAADPRAAACARGRPPPPARSSRRRGRAAP